MGRPTDTRPLKNNPDGPITCLVLQYLSNRIRFSSRTLKIVRTFLDRGSVTKKKLFTILVYIKKREIPKLGNWNLLFY